MYVWYISNYHEIVQTICYSLNAYWKSEDLKILNSLRIWFLIMNATTTDSPAPKMTKGKVTTFHDLCSPWQGLNNAYVAFEASSSHVGRLAICLSGSHQLCSWYPAQHCLQWEMMASIHPGNKQPFQTGCQAWHPSCSLKRGHCSLGNTSRLSPEQAPEWH